MILRVVGSIFGANVDTKTMYKQMYHAKPTRNVQNGPQTGPKVPVHRFCIDFCSENRAHDSQKHWFYYSKTYDSQKTGSFEIYHFLV